MRTKRQASREPGPNRAIYQQGIVADAFYGK
jgi:hypothetical protein